MATVSAPRQRRQRPTPVRTLRLLVKPDAAGPGLLSLTVGGLRQAYWLRRIDCAIGGVAFELRKFRSDDVYHVRLAGDGCSCSCLGGTYVGRCKHVDSLLVLSGREVL